MEGRAPVSTAVGSQGSQIAVAWHLVSGGSATSATMDTYGVWIQGWHHAQGETRRERPAYSAAGRRRARTGATDHCLSSLAKDGEHRIAEVAFPY